MAKKIVMDDDERAEFVRDVIMRCDPSTAIRRLNEEWGREVHRLDQMLVTTWDMIK
jgi:hypothetical protein